MPRRVQPPGARRAAADRDPGAPYRLVVLFRAPPPVRMVAGKIWAPRGREVTVVGGLGFDRPIRMIAVRRKHAWMAYANRFEGTTGAQMWTSGPLDPRDLGTVWCWGWKSKEAKALAVTWALT